MTTSGWLARPAARAALAFWVLLAAFIALDWARARPHDRFAEPMPWAFGQPAGEDTGAHCAAAPKL